MGACLCNCSGADQNTKLIEQKMKEQEKYEASLKKLLFLGAGGSGKSTIFKQLQYLHEDGFAEEDAIHLKRHIFFQIVLQMQVAMKHVEKQAANEDVKQDVEVDAELQTAIDKVREYTNQHVLSADILEAIAHIWRSDSRLEGIFEGHEKVLDESTQYFWDSIDRINDKDYVPSKKDILSVRYRTTGMCRARNGVLLMCDAHDQA